MIATMVFADYALMTCNVDFLPGFLSKRRFWFISWRLCAFERLNLCITLAEHQLPDYFIFYLMRRLQRQQHQVVHASSSWREGLTSRRVERQQLVLNAGNHHHDYLTPSCHLTQNTNSYIEVSNFFSVIPIHPQCTPYSSFYFSIIPILPRYTPYSSFHFLFHSPYIAPK